MVGQVRVRAKMDGKFYDRIYEYLLVDTGTICSKYLLATSTSYCIVSYWLLAEA